MAGRPKPLAYLIGFALIAGLSCFAFSRIGGTHAATGSGANGQFTQEELAKMKGGAEAPDANTVTTSKEYNFVPSARLPEVHGSSAYKPMVDRTVRLALNVWAGWAPLIYANHGMKAGKTWTDANGKPFKMELVLIDDPVQMRDAVAAGNVHIGWATLDMVTLFVEGLRRDSRTMPRIYQQIDFSNGGDGIVVRSDVKSVSDLRGKTCVLAQNSPSQYFLMNTLLNGGVQPGEVNMKYTQDAFQAAAAFNADKSIACVVSWAPDIYNLEKVAGNRMLVNTQTANKLIFDAMETLKSDSAKTTVSKYMADGYSIPEADARGMLGDAHWTNVAENKEFFLNQNNQANFEQTWNNAYFIYRRLGVVSDKTPFDQVMDFSLIQKVAADPKYAKQRDEYQVTFVPTTASSVRAESNEILTKTVLIQFFPNSDDLDMTITEPNGEKHKYDPNAAAVL